MTDYEARRRPFFANGVGRSIEDTSDSSQSSWNSRETYDPLHGLPLASASSLRWTSFQKEGVVQLLHS